MAQLIRDRDILQSGKYEIKKSENPSTASSVAVSIGNTSSIHCKFFTDLEIETNCQTYLRIVEIYFVVVNKNVLIK